MRYQHASTQEHSGLSTRSLSQSGPRLSGPLGNSGNIDRMHFVNDVEAWLLAQGELIAEIRGEDRIRRAHGVLRVLAQASQSFMQGEDVDVSSLPMAPTADTYTPTSAMMPEIAALVEPYQRVNVASSEGSALAPTLVPTPKPRPKWSEEQAAAKAGTLLGIKESLMGLKLKLPGESRTFPVSSYGDEESIGKILHHCVQCGITSPDQVAYILATAWHESRLGKWMTESGWLSEASAERYAEKNYGPEGSNPTRAKNHGNTEPGDGGRYMGRGYVQLTWKNNYERMSGILIDDGFSYTQDGTTYANGKNGTEEIDLVANYKHVNRNKDLAARILVLGMDGGHYVDDKKGLDHYIDADTEATHADFQGARKIVNGTDKKSLIADNAVTIQTILRRDEAWTKAYNTFKGNFHGP